jgi:hypothetical protein
VQASTGGDHVDFLLSALPSAAASVTVADWNGHPSPLTPGALMRISFVSADGRDYEPATYATPPYPTSVQGLMVSLNDVSAPILRVSGSGATTELLVQIPWEISGQETARLLLSTGAAATIVPNLPIENLHPVIRPAPASLSRIVTLPMTGLGQFAPLANTNSAGIPSQTVATHLSLSIDGVFLPILGIAADPSLAGVADVTVAIPFGLRLRLRSMDDITISAQ